MWMLLIVKLLSFKRYNYPFYKCRESGRQMQCAYSQPVSDKVVPLLFSFFCKILETNVMHCFSASSVSCVTERLSGCKDTDLYWIRANNYLKKDYSTVAFSIILIAPLHVLQSMSCRQWAILLLKYHCKLYMNQRLFGTTIVTNKMNGYDNKPVLMK